MMGDLAMMRAPGHDESPGHEEGPLAMKKVPGPKVSSQVLM